MTSINGSGRTISEHGISGHGSNDLHTLPRFRLKEWQFSFGDVLELCPDLILPAIHSQTNQQRNQISCQDNRTYFSENVRFYLTELQYFRTIADVVIERTT